MKGKELFNVLLLCCCLLILSGSFLPYISVNFPDTNAGWGARSVIQEQLPEMFEEDGTFQAAAVDLISDMQTKNKLGMVKWWFIVTLFLNLVCVLSLLMENNGKYVLILILDLVQAGLWAAGVFVVLPWALVRYSQIAVTTYAGNSFFGLISSAEMAELMKLFLKGMRIGYWMPYGMAGVSVILCIIALIKKPKSMQELREEELMQAETKAYAEGGQIQQEPVENPVGESEKPAWDMDRIEGNQTERIQLPPPGITCVAGPYQGSHAPMEFDEEVIVGNDENACSLVIVSDRVSPVHCHVRFDVERNEYSVMSTSVEGTFVNGYRMADDQWLPLQRGACIRLGRDENVLRLD